MTRILFLNRFYHPDEVATAQLLTDLAERLAAKGHDVTVITSHPGPAALAADGRHHGVRVLRLRSPRAAHTGVAGKARDYIAYYGGAMVRLAREARRGTIVVAMTDPPLLGIGAWLVARARGARVVQWAQDVYPELAVALSGHCWPAMFAPLRNASWRGADHCVAISEGIAARFAAAGVAACDRSSIENWSPIPAAEPAAANIARVRTRWNVEGKFVVGYSGNLGRVHDLESVLALATHLRSETGIVFVVVGDGAQRARLAAAAAGLPNVILQPPQPRQDLAVTLAAIDAHLVTLREGCAGLVFPSKLYGVAAVGRPVLFIGPPECDVARTVREYHLGYTAASTAIATLADAVRRLAMDPIARTHYARAGRRFATERAADVAASRWDELLRWVEAC